MTTDGTIDPALMAAMVIVSGAAITDLATRRVPNMLVAGGAMCGLSVNAMAAGYPGALAALFGCAVGLAIFLPFCLLRGMGAGDVKLMGAVGACVGFARILDVALATALVGAVLAVGMALSRGRLVSTLRGSLALLGSWLTGRKRPDAAMTLDNPNALAIPYAVAIAMGTAWTVVTG